MLGAIVLAATVTRVTGFTTTTGYQPRGQVIQASDGNFYGTTSVGGDDGSGCVHGCEFCVVPTAWGRKPLQKPVEEVVADIRREGARHHHVSALAAVDEEVPHDAEIDLRASARRPRQLHHASVLAVHVEGGLFPAGEERLGRERIRAATGHVPEHVDVIRAEAVLRREPHPRTLREAVRLQHVEGTGVG